MIRYKMVGLDLNVSPKEYRTWLVEGKPDFEANFYTGLRPHDSPLINVNAYLIQDNITIDFNLPNPLSWENTKYTLPSAISGSQLAIIHNHLYLFGGVSNSRIYQASVHSPSIWKDSGANLPVTLSGSQLIIANHKIYLFGGNTSQATNHIYSASISNPLIWTDHGPLLPNAISHSQIAIVDDIIYLLGGKDINKEVNSIFAAAVSNPLKWIDTGAQLPINLSSSQLAIVNSNLYLFGGLTTNNQPTTKILSAPLSFPMNWNVINNLPIASYNGQYFSVGDKGYLITPCVNKKIKILRCNLSSPSQWIDTAKSFPGNLSESQVGIINNRVYLFGGNGNSSIFVCHSDNKFSLDKSTSYTETINKIQSTDEMNLFQTIGFPPWKTDYKKYAK